jgi:hypothetical protein
MAIQPPIPERPAPSYLTLSIVATVLSVLSTCLCCIPLGLPFGIAGIVFSSQTNTKLAAGDYEGSANASNQARIWSFIALGLAVLQILVGTAFFILRFTRGGLVGPMGRFPH